MSYQKFLIREKMKSKLYLLLGPMAIIGCSQNTQPQMQVQPIAQPVYVQPTPVQATDNGNANLATGVLIGTMIANSNNRPVAAPNYPPTVINKTVIVHKQAPQKQAPPVIVKKTVIVNNPAPKGIPAKTSVPYSQPKTNYSQNYKQPNSSYKPVGTSYKPSTTKTNTSK
jgi:hypothetical protein